MDNDEIKDRLNTLQAQNVALMHMMAAVVKQTSADVMEEYTLRCAIFLKLIGANGNPEAVAIQRETFDEVARTILGDRNADLSQ